MQNYNGACFKKIKLGDNSTNKNWTNLIDSIYYKRSNPTPSKNNPHTVILVTWHPTCLLNQLKRKPILLCIWRELYSKRALAIYRKRRPESRIPSRSCASLKRRRKRTTIWVIAFSPVTEQWPLFGPENDTGHCKRLLSLILLSIDCADISTLCTETKLP